MLLPTDTAPAPGLTSINGPSHQRTKLHPNLDVILSQSANSPEAVTIKTFALMQAQLMAQPEVQRTLTNQAAAPTTEIAYADSFHSGFSRVVFQISNSCINASNTGNFAIKLGSSHFSEFTVSKQEIIAEMQLSQRLADLSQYAPNFAQNYYGALIEIPLPVLKQVHTGLAEWVVCNANSSTEKPALAFQICEWIDGPTLDYAMAQRMLSPSQLREVGERIIETIIGAWHATLRNGHGIIYDTDVNDIILAQNTDFAPGLSLDRPVFIDADGGRKSGDVTKLISAIELFIEMSASNCDDKATYAIKAIEAAQTRLERSAYTKLQAAMLAYTQRLA